MVPALCDSALTPIGKCPRKFRGKRAAACAVAALLALAGCGGDDEEPAATATQTTPTPTATVETPTETEPPEPQPETEIATTTAPGPSPEEVEGGAGDEEPARTLALFTGRGGRIVPRVIRVPAFISIRVELRSGDGAEYGLRFGGRTISTGGELSSSAKTFDGLRPGEALVGRPIGAGNGVRIEATAEPGP